MSVHKLLQPRWRPEDWEPSEGDIGTAVQTVKGAVANMCKGRRDFAISSLEYARTEMADGVLAGMAVMFGAFLISHPGYSARLWQLRRDIETWQLTEAQRNTFAEALGLMSAFAERDARRRDLLCGSSTVPPLRIAQAVVSLCAAMLADQHGEAWLEDFEWMVIRLWARDRGNTQ